MSKHESPPFRMKIEGGRLVPSSAWDAERLNTYRNGSMLSVQITQQKSRKLERKYWAILGKVIDHCPVQQRTTEDLHRAIKLKLGVVDAFFTIDGKLRVDVKSTASMEEPEYRLFFEDAMALLHKVTGVDPLTLGAEAADVGEDEHDTPAIPASGGSDETEVHPAAEAGADGIEAADPQTAPSVPADDDLRLRNLMIEAIDKFLYTATDPKLPEAKDRQTALVTCKNIWKDELKDRPDFVKACTDAANDVVKGKRTIEDARQVLEAMLP